jgi:hypothetical protein
MTYALRFAGRQSPEGETDEQKNCCFLVVETVHKLQLVVNLRTPREIGLMVPPNVLARADKVIR